MTIGPLLITGKSHKKDRQKVPTSHTLGEKGGIPQAVIAVEIAVVIVIDLLKVLEKVLYEPPHGKTNSLHRRKQRRRSASR